MTKAQLKKRDLFELCLSTLMGQNSLLDSKQLKDLNVPLELYQGCDKFTLTKGDHLWRGTITPNPTSTNVYVTIRVDIINVQCVAVITDLLFGEK